MHRHTGTILGRLLTAVLLVSMTMCCCTVHVLAGPGHGAVTSTACCPHCVDSGADDAPSDETDASGCRCVKWDGRQDVSLDLPAPLSTPMPLPPVLAALAPATPALTVDEAARPHAPPETLVRLHCALIV